MSSDQIVKQMYDLSPRATYLDSPYSMKAS